MPNNKHTRTEHKTKVAKLGGCLKKLMKVLSLWKW